MVKRKQMTVESKYNAVRDVEKGTPDCKVAELLEVLQNTLSGWVKKSAMIKSTFGISVWNPKVKRMQTANHTDIEGHGSSFCRVLDS